MSRPRLALLDASHGDESTRRNFRRELDATLAEFDVTAGATPATFDYDGVVVTGSRSSVYWDEAWIPDLLDWIAAADARDLPVLGVCFGHQALASALGGTVADMGEYELGYRTVAHRGGPLFDGVPQEFTAFTTHSDAVTDLPPGAELLAENDYGVHAFRKDHAFGVQFHPEYDAETARRITREKDLPDAHIRSVLDGITPAAVDAAQAPKRLFENFVDYASRVDPDREPDGGAVAGD